MPSKTFLFFYGAQKSGTTWLSNHLLLSGQVYNAGLKEWRFWKSYFAGDSDKRESIKKMYARIEFGIDRYKREKSRIIALRLKMQQDPVKFLRTCGEVVTHSSRYHILADCTPSTGTMLTESQLCRVSMLVQEMGFRPKALLLLRDPLQRSVSELSMRVRNDLRRDFTVHGKPGTLEYSRHMDSIIENNLGNLTHRSRFDVIIKRAKTLETSIPFKTILFDDLFSQNTMDDVSHFLTLEKIVISHQPVNHHETVQLSERSLRALASGLRSTYQYMKSYFGDRGFPASWSKSLSYFEGGL
ncbi:MAG: hypothetical protein HOC23_11660 [Halieaceae bacterium]|jgi:hypothetical protein|nr:hypothetical protein [Halieaceae bacterium]